MKDLGKIILYLVATVILGALLASPLYWGAQWLATLDILPSLAKYPYQKFFHRGLLIAAILLLWPAARWFSVPSVAELGLRRNPRRWNDLAFGFGASFLVMVVLAIVLVWMDVYRVRSTIHWNQLAKVATSAVVVSLIEEGLFRGALLGLLLRAMSWQPALFCISAFYSIVHFLKPEYQLPADPTIHLFSAFPLIFNAFGQFYEPWLVLGGFVTLFLVGWILGWTRLKLGSLWMAIGLHAGWIFGTMGFTKIGRRHIKDTLPWLGENLNVGIVSVFMVLVTGAIVWWWVTYRRLPAELAATAASPAAPKPE